MDFIQQCFDQHSSKFICVLKGAGFSEKQARDFLPETASSILVSNKSSDLNQAVKDLMSDNPALVLNSINVTSIAQNLGIQANQVRLGLGAIEPVLSEVMSQNQDGIVDAIASLSWGNGTCIDAPAKTFFN